jgi:hypothetical protein
MIIGPHIDVAPLRPKILREASQAQNSVVNRLWRTIPSRLASRLDDLNPV